MALWFTQPLTEMISRNLPVSTARPASMADNLAAICEPIIQKICDYQSHNPISPLGLLEGLLYFFFFTFSTTDQGDYIDLENINF
jgi:hypothetical protein